MACEMKIEGGAKFGVDLLWLSPGSTWRICQGTKSPQLTIIFWMIPGTEIISTQSHLLTRDHQPIPVAVCYRFVV